MPFQTQALERLQLSYIISSATFAVPFHQEQSTLPSGKGTRQLQDPTTTLPQGKNTQVKVHSPFLPPQRWSPCNISGSSPSAQTSVSSTADRTAKGRGSKQERQGEMNRLDYQGNVLEQGRVFCLLTFHPSCPEGSFQVQLSPSSSKDTSPHPLSISQLGADQREDSDGTV